MRYPLPGFASAPSPTTVGVPRRRLVLPPFALPLAFVTFLFAGWGENLSLGFAAIVVLLLGCALLWRPGEVPILLYIFGFQWLQVSLGIFRANWLEIPIDRLSLYSQSMGLATSLSLVGLTCLCIGMRLGSGRQASAITQISRATMTTQPWMRWFWLYLGAVCAATIAQILALYMPGLSQPLLVVANLKWAAFFALTCATLVHPGRSWPLWLAAFLVEFVLSLGGYFSSFKTVFMYTLLALLAAGVRLSRGRLVVASILFIVTLGLGVIWTAVKPEYRDFVNQGTGQQIVAVKFSERISKLIELTSQIDRKKFVDAADDLAARISYTEYFAVALEHVPLVVPHENGALWLDAITRPFMPRLFFPDKPVIDESETTKRFTGLQIAGSEEGTQISLGYMAESYVDFGKIGMMLVVFGYGLCLGFLYRWLTASSISRGLMGMSLATVALYQAGSFGVSTAKLCGGIIVFALVAWILVKFAVPRFLPWLMVRRPFEPYRM